MAMKVYTYTVYKINNNNDEKRNLLLSERFSGRDTIFRQIYGGHDFTGVKLQEGNLPFAGFCLYKNQKGDVASFVPNPDQKSSPVLMSINS
jgi:hypothetical protein